MELGQSIYRGCCFVEATEDLYIEQQQNYGVNQSAHATCTLLSMCACSIVATPTLKLTHCVCVPAHTSDCVTVCAHTCVGGLASVCGWK